MSGDIFRWAAPLFASAGRRLTAPDAEEFARLLRPSVPPNGRLLDLGGGTGALAVLLARMVPCTVTVLDSSPHMLRYAEGQPGVEAELGDAADLPFPDGSFDAVLVSDAFHHFAAPEAVVHEMARVIRPGGGVVVAELDPDSFVIRLIRVLEKALREPAGFRRPAELEELMEAAGIHGSTRRPGGPSYVFAGEVRRR